MTCRTLRDQNDDDDDDVHAGLESSADTYRMQTSVIKHKRLALFHMRNRIAGDHLDIGVCCENDVHTKSATPIAVLDIGFP
jgi:hypothetical protein